MPFPAGLTTIEVTGLNLTDFAGNPANGRVLFTAVPPQVSAAHSLVVEGSAEGVVTAGVMAPVTVPTTDSVSPVFTYTIKLVLQTADADPAPYTGISVPASLGASVDLSALI